MTGHTKWAEVKRPGSTRHPWHWWLRARIRWRWQKIARPSPWYRVRWGWHRYRHGWARPDVWDLDGYLTELIGQSLLYLRDHGHAYPHEPDPELPDVHEEVPGEPGNFTNYLTPERWNEILTKMAAPLVAYKTHWEYPDGETTDEHLNREAKIISDAQDALRLIAEWLPCLWD